MQWMHSLVVTGLLLENTSTLGSLERKAIEPPELFQSLLLPAVSLIVMRYFLGSNGMRS
jgi:condensin complex subunit 3